MREPIYIISMSCQLQKVNVLVVFALRAEQCQIKTPSAFTYAKMHQNIVLTVKKGSNKVCFNDINI